MTTPLTFWLMPNAGFESKKTIEQEIAFFQRQHPDIEVRCEVLSWSRAWFKYIQAVKEKTGPDVIQVGTTWVATLGYLGAIRKLDNRKINLSSFIPHFLKTCRYTNSLWAMPWFCDGRVLYYRRDYLEQAGISPDEITSWDSFHRACERFNSLSTPDGRKVYPLGFSSHKEQAVLQDIAGWIWGNGGDFLSLDGRHSILSQHESVRGLTFLLDLIANRFIPESSLDQSTGETAENFFWHDSYVFLFSNSWPLQVYLNPDCKRFVGRDKTDRFGVALLPSGPGGRHNFSGGSALAVTSFSQNPEAAWTFLDFMTGPESLSRYCQNICMLPGRKDLSITLSSDDSTQKTFSDAVIKHGRGFPSHPLWGSIEQIILNGLAPMLSEYRQSGYDRDGFFRNLSELNLEIEHILSVFGE